MATDSLTSNPVTIDTALKQQQQTQKTVASLAEDFTQFLNLLTTQLQHQDPMDPMDSKEFTSQLVQFSQVEQQINSNKKLDSLVQMQLSNAFGSSLNYVGHDINYMSSEFNFDGSSPVTINYALEGAAASSQLFIVNEQGEAVFSQKAEPAAGAHEFIWDGKTNGGRLLEPGTYEVRIDAMDGKGEKIENSTVVSGRVGGVETQNGQIFLLVGERAVPLSNVIKAQEPSETAENEPAEETAESEETIQEEEAV
jgi:flagellar basal-body rod modification protein FlgD